MSAVDRRHSLGIVLLDRACDFGLRDMRSILPSQMKRLAAVPGARWIYFVNVVSQMCLCGALPSFQSCIESVEELAQTAIERGIPVNVWLLSRSEVAGACLRKRWPSALWTTL